MIDKREIRIGNIIDFEYGSTDRVRVDGLFQIEGTWFVMWTKISGNGGFDRGDSILEDFKPIPLTPDILEKAGFKFEVYGHDGEQEVSAVRICSNIEINNKLMV